MTHRLASAFFALLFLLVLVPTPEAQDAPSSPDRWGYYCSRTPWGGDTRGFTLVSSDEDDGCAWRDRQDAVVQTDPDALRGLLQDLDDATHWLSRNGFRKPQLGATDAYDEFALMVYPAGGGACFTVGGAEKCVEPTEDVQLAEFPTTNMLIISSDALNRGRGKVMLNLMYATQFAYEGFSRDSPSAPAPWVSHGLAFGFAGWWLNKAHGIKGIEPIPHRHSIPLTASDADAGRQTGPFWIWAAGREPDGFALARVVIEAASGAAEEGLSVVDAVDIALEPDFPRGEFDDAEYGRNGDSGLSNAFWQFIHRTNAGTQAFWEGRGTPSGAWDTVAPEAPLGVALGRGPVERTISGHEALSAVRIPVRVSGLDGRAFGLRIRRSGHTANLVTFLSNPAIGTGWLHRTHPFLYKNGYTRDVPLMNLCADNTSCEFDVYVINANKDQASSTGTHRPYTIEVEAARTCVFPQGATGVTYAATMPEGRGTHEVMRMTMGLPERGGQRGLRTSVEGNITFGAPGVRVRPRDFTADLMCDDATFWVENLDLEGMPQGMGLGGAQVWGARLDLPQDADVGTELGRVVQFGETTQGGADTGEFDTQLTDLTITGRTRKRVEGLGEVSVWKIEGYSSGRFQMQSDALERFMEQDAEVREGLNEGSTRNDLRAIIGEFQGEETNLPITLYYSPVWGVVESVTGRDGPEQVTHRLVEVTMPRR